MSMETYVKAGMVHIKDDEEVGIEESQSESSEWTSQHATEGVQSRKVVSPWRKVEGEYDQ